MHDWLWIAVVIYLYINGAAWAILAMVHDPIYLSDGSRCRWCELLVVVLWPFGMPTSVIINLWEKVRSKRTFV